MKAPFQPGERVDSPIYDPYFAGADPSPPVSYPPPGGPPLGKAAVDRAVLDPPGRRRQKVLLFVAVSSLLTLLGAMGLVGWGVFQYRQLLAAQETVADDAEENATKSAGLPVDTDDDSDDDATADNATLGVPSQTLTTVIGRIEVVDLGKSAAALRTSLMVQTALAAAQGKTLLVMTTQARCGPCRGVEDSLTDPLMQEALAGVRLLRIDLHVFRDELAGLKLATDLYPGFFLLGPDMRPRDGIHGGEWDEDIARNIAPVLGAFVKGQYTKRRRDWSATTDSIAL